MNQKKYVTLNQVAIWHATSDVKLASRTYRANLLYVDNDSPIIQVASIERPITRYGKSYQKFDLSFSLFVFSDKDANTVEKALDNIANKTKKKDITAAIALGGFDFNYTESRID